MMLKDTEEYISLHERIRTLENKLQHMCLADTVDCEARDKISKLENNAITLAKDFADEINKLKRIKHIDSYARNEIIKLEDRLSYIEAWMSTLIDKNIKFNKKTEDLTFGEAIEHCKAGKRVSCWHNDDIYIVYVGGIKFNDPDCGDMKAYLRVRTVVGYYVPWIPNHHEILEAKWRIVPDDDEEND